MFHMSAWKELGLARFLLVLFSAFCSSASAHAQEAREQVKAPLKEALRVFADERRSPPTGPTHYSEWTLVKQYGAALIPELEPLLSDKAVRSGAHEMLVLLGSSAPRSEDRSQAILLLVRHTVGQSRYFPPGAWYSDFLRDDFSEESKRMLNKVLDSVTPENQFANVPIVMLIGASGDTSSLPKLRHLDKNSPETSPESNQLIRRYALRACARLGDKEAIAECIKIMDSLPNDDLRTQSLGALAYIRQDEAVDYIMKYLLSDGKTPYLGQDAPGIMYCRIADEILRRMLYDYPSTKAPMEEQRKWMREQKEWKIRR